MKRFADEYVALQAQATLGTVNHSATWGDIVGAYNGGNEIATDDGTATISGHAAKQLFGAVGLQVAEMNKFSNHPEAQKLMLQLKLGDKGIADERIVARGVRREGKPDQYQMFVDADKLPVLNGQVLDALSMNLPETAIIHKGDLRNRAMNLRIVDDSWEHDLGPGGGRALTALLVRNDERMGGLQISTGVTRVSCWNYTLDEHPVFAHNVGFIAPNALVDGIGEAIGRLNEVASTVAERLRSFHDVEVSDVQDMLRLMAGEMGLPNYVVEASTTWWQDAGAINTLFWVVQALSFGSSRMTEGKRAQWVRRAVAEAQTYHMGIDYAESGEIRLHECPRCHQPMNTYAEVVEGEYTVE